MDVPRMTRQGTEKSGVVRSVFGRNFTGPVMTVIGMCFASCTLAATQCSGPPALEARLKTNPAAETYASLGSWFANQKQFDCAAADFASAAAFALASCRARSAASRASTAAASVG